MAGAVVAAHMRTETAAAETRAAAGAVVLAAATTGATTTRRPPRRHLRHPRRRPDLRVGRDRRAGRGLREDRIEEIVGGGTLAIRAVPLKVVRRPAVRNRTGVRKVHRAGQAQAKDGGIVIAMTIHRVRRAGAARIGKTLRVRAVVRARLPVGMVTDAVARMAGAAAITGATATKAAGGSATTTGGGTGMATAGGMHRIIRDGDRPTTTTAATGIRNGTTTAGMTAGAGTSR
jgi:hypothetical protein